MTLACLAFTCVEDYGAQPNDGIDDTTAIQNAIDDECQQLWSLGGGIVIVGGGIYDIDPPLFISGGLTIRGGSQSSCIFRIPDGSIDPAIIIDTTAAVVIENIWIMTDRSDVSGIVVAGHNAFSEFHNVTVSGFFVGIQIEDAYCWSMDHCYFGNNVYGILIRNLNCPDTNDSSITKCTFDTSYAGSEAAIYQVAGGGLRIVNNKILHHKYGYVLDVAPGISTSILIMTSNSIEGQSGYSVLLRAIHQNSYFGYIVITGNQIANGIVKEEYTPGHLWSVKIEE